MGRTQSETSSRERYGEAAAEMHRRLWTWRQEHPRASFDEIAEQARQERQVLVGGLVGELASQPGGEPEPLCCPECQGPLQNKGKKARSVLHREGEVQLERDYYYCPGCRRGFFPPGPAVGTDAA
jgi:uncharacterized protein with PIN domain